MKIGIIEASGNIGSRTHAEARGHDVAAFTRSGAAAMGASWRDLDVFDFDALRAVVASVGAIADPTANARGPWIPASYVLARG
jgi:putative NADH-flavin reductase